MDIENIKNKIKKLLALSEDNPSDAESYAALSKAQELMAQYKLEQMDLTEEQKQECVKVKTTLCYGSRGSDEYLEDLASVVSKNFCCVNYNATSRGSRTHYICLMGLKDDVDIAQEVLHTANTQIIRGYNKVWKDVCQEYGIDYIPAKYFNPKKLGYTRGYISGLKEALESQKEKHQDWGLVLVTPKEAQDFIGGLESFSLNNSNSVDLKYYGDGYKDGKNFNMNKKINNDDKLKID